jgi:hypothetical protein
VSRTSRGGAAAARAAAALAAAALAAVVLLAGGVAAAQGAAVPRDEPEPAPEPLPAPGPAPIDDLPDYGPRPEGEAAAAAMPPGAAPGTAPGATPDAPLAAAPASQPRLKVPPLVIKRVPRFKLTYQRFVDHRLGGEASPYHVAAVSFYPLSTWVRLGCTVRFGMEESDSKKSWFLDALFSGGLQVPEFVRGVTPFVDFNVGPGFRLYTTFNNSMPALQWTFGLDAGAEVHLGGRLYVSGAVGWVRPIARIKQATAGREMVDVYGDAFIFKLGLGL